MQDLQERVGEFGEDVGEVLDEGVIRWLKGAAIAAVVYSVVKAIIWPIVSFAMSRGEAKVFVREAGDHIRAQVDKAISKRPKGEHYPDAEKVWVEYSFPLDWGGCCRRGYRSDEWI